MAKISVVVPVYNVEKYLRRCLKSILDQTFQDFEILCVNDCTPDESMKIVDEFVRAYPEKVRRIDNEKNMGLGAARDRGLREASGEYIAFFDSDDYVKPDYLEIYSRELERTGADIVLGGYIRVVQGKETKVSVCDTADTPWLYPAVWMRLYRRSFLTEHGLDFRGIRTYEDNPFDYRCMLEGAKVSVIDYCGYYYICNPTSITRTKNGVAKYRQFVQNFRGVYEEYAQNPAFQKNKEIMEYAYLSAMLSCMLLQSLHSGKDNALFMYGDYKRQMEEMFPDYKKNRKIGFGKLKEEQKKVRIAAAIFMLAEKLGLGKLMMLLISL